MIKETETNKQKKTPLLKFIPSVPEKTNMPFAQNISLI